METTTDLADTPLADLLTRARELALAEDPEAAHETLWETVEALRGPHAGEEVFEAALGWSGDAEPQVRALGRDVLGQFAAGSDGVGAYAERSVPHLVEALDDLDPTALGCAVVALGHLHHWRPWDAAPVAALATRDEASLRFDVAHALCAAVGEGSKIALETLLTVMDDADEEVRDWATFGVAESGVDDDRIREALFARPHDAHEDTRLEAIKGLASRDR